MENVNKIFVYGTLMNGFLKDIFPGIDLHIKRTKPGTIKARLFDLKEYPGAKQTRAAFKRVSGEIHEIEKAGLSKILKLLDEYEGYDASDSKASLYIRKLTGVTTESREVIKAWVYWYNRSCNKITEIKEGDYNKYLKRNK